MSNHVRSGEILFVKSVKDGIPNRDPLRDSDARRVFPEGDGRISLSDVSLKRDVRDYILARYPEGGDDNDRFVFCREERTDDGKLMGRDALAVKILERAGRADSDDLRDALMQSAFDMRTFGAVFSVKKKSFHQVGPVQFGWAHSLHPVETKYVQGTVVMPAKDARPADGDQEAEGATQGTIWTTYILPFAVFAMPGVISAPIAADTGMTREDVDLLLQGLWFGTMNRQARGRGVQKPLLLVHVEYSDPFFRVGYLEEKVRLMPNEREAWLGSNPPSRLAEVKLDVSSLVDTLDAHKGKVARVRVACADEIELVGGLTGEELVW